MASLLFPNLQSCGEDPVPKPRAQLRLEYGDSSYKEIDTTDRFLELFGLENLEDLHIKLKGLDEDVQIQVEKALESLKHNVYIAEDDGDGDCLIKVEEVDTDGEHHTRDVHVQCFSGDQPQVITIEGHGEAQQVKAKKLRQVVDTPDDRF